MTHHYIKTGLFNCAAACLLAFAVIRASAAPAEKEIVYVGSAHKNITAFWLDMASGALTPMGDVAQIAAPSFFTISPSERLYAVTEGRAKDSSFVSAYRIDSETAKLSFINRQPAGGAGPCYVSVDHDADGAAMNVLAANYASGSVSVFHLDLTGALSPMTAFIQDHGSSINPDRQAGPHAHCILTDANNHYAFACDLGLDKVLVFKFDASAGTLTPNDPPFAMVKPGSGPRHIAFHPNGRFAYVINEMASTLDTFAYDPGHGVLTRIEEHPLLAADFKGQSTAAEVAIYPTGKYVYASNRGEDSIVVFACDPDTGRLTFIERDSTQGKTPRDFDIDPTGAFLMAANQGSGTIVVFRLDPKTGRLQSTGNTATADAPTCVKCMAWAKRGL